MDGKRCKKKLESKAFQVSALAFAIHMMTLGSGVILPVSVSHAAEALQTKQYDIPAGSLAKVLNTFANQVGVALVIDARQLDGKNSLGLSGYYTVENGFEKILDNTGFSVLKAGQGYTVVRSTALQSEYLSHNSSPSEALPSKSGKVTEVVKLKPMVVYGQQNPDSQGYSDVYDKNRSSVYLGKDYVERFKGTNPADVLQGMVGVYSGDARNSGAIDPSIRGVQGVGRVPLTIDGTEQSIAVWRGYNGVNNRNYIDPNLIAGVEVIKGPAIERNVMTSVGGGVVVKTLEATDIVRPGEKYGAELKIEASSNSIHPQFPNMSKIGKKYNETVPWIEYVTSDGTVQLFDPDFYKANRTKSDNSFFSGDDKAGRLALAMTQDKFDLLAVYAVRERGNYFSGTNRPGYYRKADPNSSQDFIPYFAYVYVPGSEVPNTSSQMESWLFKGTYRSTDEQTLKFTYRDSKNRYGEIMPSRISWGVSTETGVPQWPLSEVSSKAYNLEYKLKPDGNKWLDFYASLWRTDTKNDTYTRGGAPTEFWPLGVSKNDQILKNLALSLSDNTREGINISNKMSLFKNLDLTFGGSFLKEKLTSGDDFAESAEQIYGGFSTLAMPRAGRREEKMFDFNFNFRPTSWLTLDAGMRYRSYWAFDDFLDNRIKQGSSYVTNDGKEYRFPFTNKQKLDGYTYTYRTMPETRVGHELRNFQRQERNYRRDNPDWDGDYMSVTRESSSIFYNAIWSQKNEIKFKADENGRMSPSELLNGLNQILQPYTGLSPEPVTYQQIPINQVTKTKDSGWAPQFTIAANLTPNQRVYARYAEEYRLPSLFESTVGFSALQPYLGLKPEHAFNYEIGYVYDLRDLFKSARNADFKLAYYYNKTKNVIERSHNLIFTNMDEQLLSGLELQSRFDNGAFFTDLSASYNLKNRVCDTDTAASRMIEGGVVQTANGLQFKDQYQRCVDDGFPNGYLATMATPEVSIHALLGTRLMDERLELGSRITYHKAYQSPLRKENVAGLNEGYYFNVPLAWDDIWLLDAYARYQVDRYNTVELIGTNLTNQFYIDPLTRSAMAAPGRTMKISWTTKF
ncbi:TonB-dependent receptor [Acinetobacter stercoris]|uniref:Putative TonB-dependent receptor n=1 Tax=Acinetobacter stercoris TaxID=2126983 RepID=A0A2U3N2Q7_9GAMM|nr:TonB-dependent receptor [Acinetobacter stercoris]SPL71904.1 putative TonB-dependent receptor precursor [Acinetobacter stercoris]